MKHGTLVKENAEATYAQMPAIVRDEFEKAQAQFYEIEWKDVPSTPRSGYENTHMRRDFIF